MVLYRPIWRIRVKVLAYAICNIAFVLTWSCHATAADGDAAASPLDDIPSIAVQNWAINPAIVSLVSRGNQTCGISLRIPPGEKLFIKLKCNGNELKIRVYDQQTSQYIYQDIVVNGRYETYANGKSWAMRDVTNEVTR